MKVYKVHWTPEVKRAAIMFLMVIFTTTYTTNIRNAMSVYDSSMIAV